jgi:hypothetical protein
MFVTRAWSYTLTEHNPAKPWLIVSVRRGMTVELEEHVNFFTWAAETWPPPQFSVELDPYQILANRRR